MLGHRLFDFLKSLTKHSNRQFGLSTKLIQMPCVSENLYHSLQVPGERTPCIQLTMKVPVLVTGLETGLCPRQRRTHEYYGQMGSLGLCRWTGLLRSSGEQK